MGLISDSDVDGIIGCWQTFSGRGEGDFRSKITHLIRGKVVKDGLADLGINAIFLGIGGFNGTFLQKLSKNALAETLKKASELSLKKGQLSDKDVAEIIIDTIGGTAEDASPLVPILKQLLKSQVGYNPEDCIFKTFETEETVSGRTQTLKCLLQFCAKTSGKWWHLRNTVENWHITGTCYYTCCTNPNNTPPCEDASKSVNIDVKGSGTSSKCKVDRFKCSNLK